MKKLLCAALCSAVVAAAAAPALADHQIGGYYRTTFIRENLTKKEGDAARPATVVDNRLRARWQNNINEFVTVVWFGEVDAVWGMQSKGNSAGGIGNGGKQGADGVNVETKHAFLDVKIPSTPVSTRIGIQPVGDASFGGVVMNDDMAGATVNVKTDKVGVMVGWVKLDEGASTVKEDDSDLYFLQVPVTPMPGLKVTPEVYYAKNNGSYSLLGETLEDSQMFYAGLGAGFKAGPVDLSGFFLYQGGDFDVGGDTIDVSAWAASVKAAATVADAKLALRVLFFPASSDDEDITFVTPPNNSNGAFEFFDDGLAIFLADIYYMNTAGGRLALTDAAYAGYGLLGAVANGSFTLPTMKALTFKAAVGYFMATDDEPDGFSEREGTDLGLEVAASVGYKVAEKAEFILRGAYAMLGGFYDKTAGGGEDPDDLYKLALTVNVPY